MIAKAKDADWRIHGTGDWPAGRPALGPSARWELPHRATVFIFVFGGDDNSSASSGSNSASTQAGDKGSKEQRAPPLTVAPPERDLPLQWGSCKRLRCVKVREEGSPAKSDGPRRATSRINRRIVAGGDKDFPTPRFRHPARLLYRMSESVGSENLNQRSRSVTSSPEKEDRCYATRGSLVPHGCEGENVKAAGSGGGGGVMDERGGAVALPRFFISLSNKEKEEDFMAMKGCKLPQRPKKRSKYIQKCILLVSPGTWLPDLSQERYEVREKKGSRKRKRGLKAMSLESDSE